MTILDDRPAGLTNVESVPEIRWARAVDRVEEAPALHAALHREDLRGIVVRHERDDTEE